MTEIQSDTESAELLSDDVQEIIGKVPPWIVRWGITLVFVVLTGAVVASFVFKYPDVITSSITILSENPPVSIIANTKGNIDTIFVHNEQKVIVNEVLAILESTANYQHVREVKAKLNQLSSVFYKEAICFELEFSNRYTLGPIQSSFSTFQRQYTEYLSYTRINNVDKKIASIRQQFDDYSRYLASLELQVENYKRIERLSYSNFKRDSSSFTIKGISAYEFEKAEQNYLQIRNGYQSMLSTIETSNIELNKLRYQIIELHGQKEGEIQRLLSMLLEAFNNLNTSIAEWEQSFVLASPIEGKVIFTGYWKENQYVEPGVAVFTVVPENEQRTIGRIKLPIAGSGKVEVGQQTNIKLDNFPYKEYGIIEGRVESVSLIPAEGPDGAFYTVEVSLPYGLYTSYKKLLPFGQQMQGDSEIVIKNMSLFDRLMQPLKSSIHK